jgi:adenylate kinase family enzyme
MVIGGPGSGKSTLSKRIHELTGLPLYHLDKLHWRPGWVAPPKDEWRQQVSEIAGRDEWIIDGGYSNTFHLRMPRTDTIVWLDFPRRVCFPCVLKRLILNFGRVREDVAPGCPERLDFAFLQWAWTFQRAHAAKYRLALETFAPHAHVMVLTNGRETKDFIQTLSR